MVCQRGPTRLARVFYTLFCVMDSILFVNSFHTSNFIVAIGERNVLNRNVGYHGPYILGGNSEIGSHVRWIFFICLRHLIIEIDREQSLIGYF